MLQELVQQIEETARSVVNEVHTALPGEVISFNPDSGMATVKPMGQYVTPDGTKLSYPTITDVPMTYPFCQSVGAGIAFPVVKGDSCLIVVSEVELDEWRSGAESEASLRFDLTSAMAIPGLLHGGGDIITKACKNNAVVIGAGGTEIMVSSDSAVIDSDGKQIKVSDSGVEVKGNLKVVGNITATGSIG